MSNLEEHDAEQAAITALCEAGECDHPDCQKKKRSAVDVAQHIIDTIAPADDSNVRRAARVFLTVYPGYDDETLSQGISDALCDLRHLCDLAGFDFSQLDREGHGMYLEELRDCGIAVHAEFKAAIEDELQ